VWCNFPPYSADNKARLIETVIGPAAMAAGYDGASDAWHVLTERTHRWAVQSGEHGPIAACLGGLDLALWDMTARKSGVPLWRLLGVAGDPRGVRAYASGLNPDTAFDTVQRCRNEGFAAFKLKVGFDLEGDLGNVERITADLRPGERLMVDVNQGWTVEVARQAVPCFAEHGLGWIEEPILADRPAAEWAEVAMLSAVPLAGGENVSGFAAFDRLINQGHHRVVQPDMLKWGGMTGCRAVARRALAKGLAYCPHWLGGGLGLVAAAHLLATVGGEGVLEHDVMENPLREALAQPFPKLANGVFPLPEGPGLGVAPDLERLKPWLVARHELTR
jgi:L-alanine-DL-glutamate epimerase-like enolase superfamily enzyme